MPSVINGIGTWQYGKKNLTSHVGTCSQCGNTCRLDSYDTREYFVVLFIPIIPLARYHNLEHCSRCNRWKQMPLEAWERAKDSSLNERLQQFSAAPHDYKAACQLYASYKFFQKHDEANKLLLHIRTEFANEPDVMLFAGQSYFDDKKMNDARECFERARALQPENKDALRGVIITMVETGDLDDARALLEPFLAEPTPDNAGLVVYVASAYQKHGQHNDARALFQKLQAAKPTVVKDAGFRKAMRTSENALGLKSALPPEPFNVWKAVWPAVGVVVLALLLWRNYYVSQHQTLHLVSGVESPVTVQVDGDSRSVPPGAHVSMIVPEGTHHVKIVGPAPEEFDIAVHSGFFGRYFSSPAFVVNVSGSALVVHKKVTYAVVAPPPPEITAHPVDRFVTYPDVDYIFESPPQTIQMERNETKTKTVLEVMPAAQAEVAKYLMSKGGPGEAYSYTLTQLRYHPRQPLMLLAVLSMLAVTDNKVAETVDFLREECEKRPVEPEWHRNYQTLAEHTGKGLQLQKEYDALLAAAPNDANLLYLRGRVSETLTSADDFAKRAVRADPRNSYAHRSLGFIAASRGNWKEAKSEYQQSAKLDANAHLSDQLFEARLALGEFADLEKELRAKLTDSDALTQLMEVLSARNQPVSLHKFVLDMRNTRVKPEDKVWNEHHEAIAAYLLDEMSSMSKPPAINPNLTIAYYLARGQVDAAAKAVTGPAERETTLLTVAVAYADAGNAAKHDEFLQKALAKLSASGAAGARMATRMKASAAPDVSEVADTHLEPVEKALCLIELADKFPAQKAAYLKLAKTLNMKREFPFLEIQKAIEKRMGK